MNRWCTSDLPCRDAGWRDFDSHLFLVLPKHGWPSVGGLRLLVVESPYRVSNLLKHYTDEGELDLEFAIQASVPPRPDQAAGA